MVERTAPLVKSVNDIVNSDHYSKDDQAASATLVQAGPTILLGYEIHNTTGSDAFLQLFNAAAASDVTVGTTTADYIVPNSANGIAQGGYNKRLSFKLGLVIASTTATDGSSGAAQDINFEFA